MRPLAGAAAMLLCLMSARAELDDEPAPPPGSPPTRVFEGPWFSTQLVLSLAIGLTSFFTFCLLRTRWEVVYMGRTKLKDFSPTPAHTPDVHANGSQRFFGWIVPTYRVSEFAVLQTVGLDAAVLLNFFRMSFILFSTLAFLAAVVLMPLNLFRHGSTDSDPDYPPDLPDRNSTLLTSPFALAPNNTTPITHPTLSDLILNPTTSSTLHLLFTYLFTFLVLASLHRNFHRFVTARQAFSLHLLHSISSRTVFVSNVPRHLRGDKVLAEYFEKCGWTVDSVSCCREVESLRRVLEKRTNALVKLEEAWVAWVGNPASRAVKGYDPEVYSKREEPVAAAAGEITSSPRGDAEPLLVTGLEGNGEAGGLGDTSSSGHLSERPSFNAFASPDPEDPSPSPAAHGKIRTNRPRPTYRPRWFGSKVDAIEFWEKEFRKADEEVRQLRKKGRFEAGSSAFVTFEDVKDAQTACQVVHYPQHSELITELAPEPRDVVWSKVSMSRREAQIRDVVVVGFMALLLTFWIIPVSSLATLLSYEEIKKLLPWLANIIDSSPRLEAIVQNTLPTLAIVSFNGLLPFLLEWMSYEQGYKSRSGTEYSLMRKYHLFLLVSVLFIFVTTTFWTLVRELADTPMKIPEKLATALQASNTKNFMISYVMLQAFGLMPMQLLNLGPLFSLGYSRALFAKTPRDYAEANAPPQLNYGWVYPQALLVFTITLVFGVVSPLILVFGAIYFGTAYIVYKYKLLFIYFKPYESNGSAWPITFARLLWGLVIFQIFMTGLFSLRASPTDFRSQFWLPLAMLPLIVYTIWRSVAMMRDFHGLSKYLAMSSINDVLRGEGVSGVVGVEEGGVSRSESNLSHRRYAMNDETLYVAPSDNRTDYSQPPMTSFYYGVLNTGRRRYAHPALSGRLPEPWLPGVERDRRFGDGAKERRGVVLSLRRKGKGKGKGKGKKRRGSGSGEVSAEGEADSAWPQGDRPGYDVETASRASSHGGGVNPWSDPIPTTTKATEPSGGSAQGGWGKSLKKMMSWDVGSGVIALPDDDAGNVWREPSSGARAGIDEEDEDEDEEEEEDDREAGEGGEMDGGGGGPESPSTYFHHPERRRTISGFGGEASGPTQPERGLPQ